MCYNDRKNHYTKVNKFAFKRSIIRKRFYCELVKRLLLTADYTYRQSRKKLAIFPFNFNVDLLERLPMPEHYFIKQCHEPLFKAIQYMQWVHRDKCTFLSFTSIQLNLVKTTAFFCDITNSFCVITHCPLFISLKYSTSSINVMLTELQRILEF